ncbi:integrase core domain-containing protein [Laribacter hongkongensis]|uniref:integrase core domain-containing protein n=1 Tax=Laribacter hongkongensis TaxID=168471 RepID=UPI0035713849
MDNGPEFTNRLQDARQRIEVWRQDYNHVRPHNALNYLTPAEFREQHLPQPSRIAT